MYGSNPTFTAKIPYPEKSFVLRLPTSEEITVYLNSYSKKNRKDDDRTPDVDLFEKIRAGDKAVEGEADEFECSYLINNTLSQDVTACEKTGDVYTVTLHTPFGDTTHNLRPPTLKEMSIYRTGLMSQDSKASRLASVKLYDALADGQEGYAPETPVPLMHKSAVVNRIYTQHSQIDPIQSTDPNE